MYTKLACFWLKGDPFLSEFEFFKFLPWKRLLGSKLSSYLSIYYSPKLFLDRYLLRELRIIFSRSTRAHRHRSKFRS